MEKINKKRNLMEDISPIEDDLESTNLVSFKDITLVRNVNTEEIKFFNKNRDDELRDDIYQYFMTLNAVLYEHDYGLEKQLNYYENKLFNKAEKLEKYRNLSIEDIILVNKVFSLRKKIFKISTQGINFQEMIIFLKFISDCNDELYEKFINFKNNFKDVGVRTFLSLEHGGFAMGQKILELGSVLEQENAQRIFNGYAEIIDQADQLQSRLEQELKNKDDISKSLKDKIPYQLYDALLLRAKDILVGAHMVVSGTIEGKLDIDGVCNALSGVSIMLDILNDLGTEQKYRFQKTFETKQNHKYIVNDPRVGYDYGLKLFLRSHTEKNAQARINFELSFDTDNPNPVLQKSFYNEIISHTQNKTIVGSTLRIGIDREDYNGIGHVSLDFGRSERKDDELTRTGDVLGNLLSYASISGHHTTDPFSPEFGEPELFAQLVNLLGQSLLQQK